MKIISRQKEWEEKKQKLAQKQSELIETKLPTPPKPVQDYKETLFDKIMSAIIITTVLIGLIMLFCYLLKGTWDAGEYRSEASWINSQEYKTGTP